MRMTSRSAIAGPRDGLNKVVTKLYLFLKRENIDKIPKYNDNDMVVVTKSRIESRLYNWKVLTPLMSVVLNGDHLVSYAH